MSTSWWCQHAWLPSGLADGVTVVADDAGGGHLGHRGHPPGGRPGPAAPVSCCRASPTPTRTPSTGRCAGAPHGDGGTFWTWREPMYALADRLDPDTYLALATAVYAEMALAGVTCVGEFHYLHHGPGGARYADPNAMGEALREAAARRRHPDHPARHLLPAGRHRRAARAGCSAGSATGTPTPGRTGSRRSRTTTRSGSAPRCTRSGRCRPTARRHRAGRGRLAGGACQHRGARCTCTCPSSRPRTRPAWPPTAARPPSCSPSTACSGRRRTAVHATHLTDADIALLGGPGRPCCICPTTERDLADGIGPARQLADAGSPLTLGSDQHVLIDLLAEVAGLEMHERLLSGQRGRFTVDELVSALSPRPVTPRWAGPRPAGSRSARCATWWPRPHLAAHRRRLPAEAPMVAAGPDVDTVVVGGRTVVDHGRHLLLERGRAPRVPERMARAVAAAWGQA